MEEVTANRFTKELEDMSKEMETSYLADIGARYRKEILLVTLRLAAAATGNQALERAAAKVASVFREKAKS